MLGVRKKKNGGFRRQQTVIDGQGSRIVDKDDGVSGPLERQHIDN
jgi:hypothetical protein